MSSVQVQYSQQSFGERLIAAGRMILGIFFILALWLDPSDPVHYASTTYLLVAVYLAYAAVVSVPAVRQFFSQGVWPLFTHAIDLLLFGVVMFLTQGPSSPFFVYFVFLLVCATLRWHWRGTMWTALAALSIVAATALFPTNLFLDRNFELNGFIIRTGSLTVMAILLGYLGAHQAELRSILSNLAVWPRLVPSELPALAEDILRHAAGILSAPRTVLIWEDEDEPWLYVASWSDSHFQFCREHPAAFGAVVAGPLSHSSFFCRDARHPHPQVIATAAAGLRRWEAPPLETEFQERFEIDAVLALQLKGERFTGYLMALDKPQMTTDDLVLGEIVVQEASTRLDLHYVMKQLQQAAVSGERVRLARDLHDGLLQTLTAAALQLETAQRLTEAEPQTARQRIKEIQQMIATAQRDLRSQIDTLRPLLRSRPPENFELAPRLEELAERIRHQWPLSVRIVTFPPAPRIAGSMAREVYFVVHEALINAVRHAGATTLEAQLRFEPERVLITVTDDGHGFSFRGTYDHEKLFDTNRGPVTLKERVAALQGTLAIDSQETGARLEIALPLPD